MKDQEAKLREFAKKHAPRERKEQWAHEEVKEKYGDMVPDVTPDNIDPVDAEIDDLLARVRIEEAYTRWCDKAGTFEMRIGSRPEGIMIRCPIPGHEDATPSASMNIDKGVWHCHACEQGGDAYDLAAWHFGFDVPGYKQGENFPKLREAMAQDLGLVVVRSGGEEWYEDAPESSSAEHPSPHDTRDEPAPEPDNVVELTTPLTVRRSANLTDWENNIVKAPAIGWEKTVARGTFLWDYMVESTKDNYPTNYHLWNGLLLLGMANGRYMQLESGNGRIKSNLYICHYGGTATGKSMAFALAKDVMIEALPYISSAHSSGARYIGNPASPEAIHDAFHKELDDGSGQKEPSAVNAVIYADEFATVLQRRQGNDIKPALTEFYSARGPQVRTRANGDDVWIEEPFCSFVTGTQPRVIRRYLTQSDADSGFLNRIIFACADYMPWRSILLGQQYNVTKLADELRSIWRWAEHNEGIITFTEEGYERFLDLSMERIQPMFDVDSDSDDEIIAFTSRIELHLLKLLLLMAINEAEVEIGSELVERTVDGFLPALVMSYSAVKKDIERDETEENMQRIIEAIEALNVRGYPPSKRDIRRSRLRHKSPDAFHKAFESAEKLGLIKTINYTGENGRRYQRVVIGDDSDHQVELED